MEPIASMNSTPIEVKSLIVWHAIVPDRRSLANVGPRAAVRRAIFTLSTLRQKCFREILDVLFPRHVHQAAWVWATTNMKIGASSPHDWVSETEVVAFVTTQIGALRAGDGRVVWEERLIFKVADAASVLCPLVDDMYLKASEMIPLNLGTPDRNEYDRAMLAGFHLFIYHDLWSLKQNKMAVVHVRAPNANRFMSLQLSDFMKRHFSVLEVEQMLVLQFAVEDRLNRLTDIPRNIFEGCTPPTVAECETIFPFHRLSPFPLTELHRRFCARYQHQNYMLPTFVAMVSDFSWGFPPDDPPIVTFLTGYHGCLITDELYDDPSRSSTARSLANQPDRRQALSAMLDMRPSYSQRIDMEAREAWIDARLHLLGAIDDAPHVRLPGRAMQWYREMGYAMWKRRTFRLLQSAVPPDDELGWVFPRRRPIFS